MTEVTSPRPIVKLLSKKIDLQLNRGKTFQEIAQEIGYKPKMLELLLDGTWKVPLDKVPQIAKSLNIEPRALFRLALQQFWSADEETLDLVLGPS
jgi:cyanate lyase